jgi:hypothetical protein
MSMSDKNNWDKLTAGRMLSKLLFVFQWFVLALAIFLFIIGSWKLGIIVAGFAILTVFTSYRLAGGKRNPAIWESKDLYDLLKNAFLSGKAKIGFHSLRDQNSLLNKLASIGINKKPTEDARQFIRDKVVMNRQAFDICRDSIIIQMIHNHEEWFWNGYGKLRNVQYFHVAEIIFDLDSSIDYMFSDVLEGLKSVDNNSSPGKLSP